MKQVIYISLAASLLAASLFSAPVLGAEHPDPVTVIFKQTGEPISPYI
jgi:hypothetical protein